MSMLEYVNCPMRHENGNCLPCGGFCTAVNKPICEAMQNAYRMGQHDIAEKIRAHKTDIEGRGSDD